MQDIPGLVVLVLEIIALIVVGVTLDPKTSSFVTYDATLSQQYNPDSSIPYWLAILVPLISLFISFGFFEYCRRAWSQELSSLREQFGIWVVFFLDFVEAGVVNGIITDVTKNLVGRYRPDWLSRCQPAIVNPVEIQGFGMAAADNPECTRTDLPSSKIDDGHKSFPSGHSSTAFCLGLFVCGHCIWQLFSRWKDYSCQCTQMHKRALYSLTRSLVFLWILLQVGWAWGVAVSRVVDNKHHVGDIVAGAVLGGIVGTMFVFKSVQRVSHDIQPVERQAGRCGSDEDDLSSLRPGEPSSC